MAKQENIQPVIKPYLRGSFHGRDAWAKIPKKFLGMLGIVLLYFIGGTLLGLGGIWGSVIPMTTLILIVAFYQFGQGQDHGTADVNLGEILYGQEKEGRPVDPQDLSHCYHPLKGFFVALIPALPFVALALVHAFLAQKTYYSLGVLPSWTEEMKLQDEFAGALQYYSLQPAMTGQDVLRALVRGMCLPLITIAKEFGNDAILVAERLCPLFLLVPPLCYGIGYLTGPGVRTKINTGIKIGVEKKRRKMRKERRRRRASNTPERLI